MHPIVLRCGLLKDAVQSGEILCQKEILSSMSLYELYVTSLLITSSGQTLVYLI